MSALPHGNESDPRSLILNGERLIGLFAASRVIPGYRDNAHVNPSTLFRWIVSGVRTANGANVKLDAVRCGKRWLTSVEAVARFCAACSEQSITPSTVTKSSHKTIAAAASAELDRLGMK